MPMSQAIWRAVSAGGRPSRSRRRGKTRPAWSQVRKKTDVPASLSNATGGGSSGSRSGGSTISLIDLGVMGTEFGVRHFRGLLGLDPLEAQIGLAMHHPEPLGDGFAPGEVVEGG